MTRPLRALRASAPTALALSGVVGLAGSSPAAPASDGQVPTVRVHGRTYAVPNPYSPTSRAVPPSTGLTGTGTSRRSAAPATPVVRRPRRPGRSCPAGSYREAEPAGVIGRNDGYPTMEPLHDLGIGRPGQALDVAGRLSVATVTPLSRRTHEDQGSIPQATRTGIGARLREVRVASRIGDGPHGSSGPADSFNTYLRSGSDRVGFVGRALGNVVSHEVGHLIGSFHTDNGDRATNLMDAGGQGFAGLYGVGPDGVGGTADDPDVDFGPDRYLPAEGFTGQEDTLNNSAWAFVAGAP